MIRPDTPAGFDVMVMVGPRALAIMLEPTGVGPITTTADGITTKVTTGVDRVGLIAMIEAAVDILARYTIHDTIGDDIADKLERLALDVDFGDD